MQHSPLRTVLLGCALAAMVGTVGSAQDAGTAKPTMAAVPVPHLPFGPPLPNYKGGTAIINFVARVDDTTMSELAAAAQNAVIGGAEAIRINISSQGGSTFSSQFAVNVLKNLPVPVETVAMSEIASAAVALFCAGEKRSMADGTALYLHQQRGYDEIQDKTAAAVLRSHRISTGWYRDLMHACIDTDADRLLVDYSARDVVIDKAQATDLGMVTTPMGDLTMAKVWGPVRNIVTPDKPVNYGYPRRSGR